MLKTGKYISTDVFIALTIAILWFAAIYDPIGFFFGIRYVALFFLILSLIIISVTNRLHIEKYSLQSFFIFLFIFFNVYGLLIYFLQGKMGDFKDTSYIASGLLILTSFLYYNLNLLNFGLKTFIISLRTLSFIISIIGFIEFYSLENVWLGFFTESNSALISFRTYANIRFPYIYFLASPMLIYLIAFDLDTFMKRANLRTLILLLISTISLMLSGTRSHILLGILFFPIFLIITGRCNKLYGFIVTLLIIPVIIILGINLNLNEILSQFFSTSEASNEIKIKMIPVYMDIFSDPITLIFGQGFNAHNWSIPLQGIIALEEGATKTELTYLEILRVFGMFVGLLIIISLIYLVFAASKLSTDFRWIYPALIIYLVNAAINPYLFSTNGILPIALIISIIKNNENKKYLFKSIN